MTDSTHLNEVHLKANDIAVLENAASIAAFFGALKYDVSSPVVIQDPVSTGIGNEDLARRIIRLEQIGTFPNSGDITVFLVEVRSITAKLRNDLANAFRTRSEEMVIAVITRDYDELDFVLIVKEPNEAGNARGGSTLPRVRPISLLVKRQRPKQSDLRTLRRLTRTNDDVRDQQAQLLSAFDKIKWSEEFFNNRALFSDYYLKNRLADPKTPPWNKAITEPANRIGALMANAVAEYTGSSENDIRQRLLEPIFQILGFAYDLPPAQAAPSESAASAEEQVIPDYLLHTPDKPDTPLAAVLAYVWGRNLDDVDPTRDPEPGTPWEIPGASVVSLLEQQVAPWVIVTNGKMWRLYSATASNKATNYYEIDLEKAITASDDRETAFKYWWLLFRREAFEGFLDNVLIGSKEYAKELGARLKDLVFEEIFPHFAQGFIADMQRQGVTNPDAETLQHVFEGTLTFLYRVMFVLYAESLELLPVHEHHGYREQSLLTLKKEIAIAGGDIEGDRDGKLTAKYSAKTTDLYDRLKHLFTVIENGSAELNMPIYNGGLFSAHSENGVFLDRYAIPDRHLALGLDKLARAVDEKSKALAFIDFKSLGVRHLGSIYEGLLEFKLKKAEEDLAVKREGGKEVYLPAKKVTRPLAKIAKGSVYLANDKSERKATGSYYTPDYIVKYIVKQTVGPVLEARFAELAPRLRRAQRGYGENRGQIEAKRKAFGKDNDPELFWTRDEMVQLRDDCLNLRVLDPAMGSGHFLVEAVDFISNRLIDFLNGWSKNPVWHYIEEMRRQIVDDLEQQNVKVDAERLTRVALLKRAVLKRCIYGVDLNGMAVELAKVSLWLDAFTLGAPLSFLDHHLKQGNSLIGARIGEVEEAIEASIRDNQTTLFAQDNFEGLSRAVASMNVVNRLTDNTIGQWRDSSSAFERASSEIAPYKRILDIYTSRWFGNADQPARRGKKGFSLTLEFLRREEAKAWIHDTSSPLPNDYMDMQQVADTALRAAADKHFFHWELEFPEVFFAASTPGGLDVRVLEDGGFDAVVGNPPYGFRQVHTSETKSYLQAKYSSAQGSYEHYSLFYEAALSKIVQGGRQGFITPITWLAIPTLKALRQYILDNFGISEIVWFAKPVFDDAQVNTLISVIQNDTSSTVRTVLVPSEDLSIEDLEPRLYNQSDFVTRDYSIAVFETSDETKIIESIEALSSRMDAFANVCSGYNPYEVGAGVAPEGGPHTTETVKAKPYHSTRQIDQEWRQEIGGGDVTRFSVEIPPNRWVKYGEWLSAPRDPDNFLGNRLLIREVTGGKGKRIFAGLYDGELYHSRDVIPVKAPNSNISAKFLLSIINSTLLTWYHHKRSPKSQKALFPKLLVGDVSSLPIRDIAFNTLAADRARLAQAAIAHYVASDNDATLAAASAALGEGKSDVVHDVLAHLAQQMIDLNKSKQAEIKRFLAWLESKLKIKPKNGAGGIDSLSGKTYLQDYLGDYQKGEKQRSWRDFYYVLHKNKNRFVATLAKVEGEIEAEYEKSLAVLLPIKQELARTDALIDKIVYRLYGLTDAEIELIERPQFEQAVSEAKERAAADASLDDDARASQIVETILPAAERYFERVSTLDLDAALDELLPNWRALPDGGPTIMRSFVLDLKRTEEDVDSSGVVLYGAKAIEVTLHAKVFAPFRERHTVDDCHNEALKKFMAGEHALTLGNLPFILPSSKEAALRRFAAKVIDFESVAQLFADAKAVEIRNRAIHREIISRAEAEHFGEWAINVLRSI